MTPTELATALRDVEVANEETNLTKFQSDAAIVEEAAEALENITIECKDLEWNTRGESHHARGVICLYSVGYDQARNPYWVYGAMPRTWDDSIESAQAAANDHNKQQFQNIIEEWRKG